MMKKSIKVRTTFSDDTITQTISDDEANIISETVVNMQDEQLQRALIDLGWTPPSRLMPDASKQRLQAEAKLSAHARAFSSIDVERELKHQLTTMLADKLLERTDLITEVNDTRRMVVTYRFDAVVLTPGEYVLLRKRLQAAETGMH